MRRTLSVVLWVLGVVFSPLVAADEPTGQGVTFESVEPGTTPDGWFSPVPGYEAIVVQQGAVEGERCLVLRRERGKAEGGPFGNVMTSFSAKPYQGKRVRFLAAVRLERAAGEAGTVRAQLWLRADRANGEMGAFDNMGDRPITSEEWKRYEIVRDIDPDAERLNIGMMLIGAGMAGASAYLDEVKFEVIEGAEERAYSAHEPTEREVANLAAFARLLGYVRFFHPSDEAAEADWQEVAVRGAAEVIDASDAGELAERLRRVFVPLAPTLVIAADGEEIVPPALPESDRFTAWRHHGYEMEGDPRPNIYRRERVRTVAGEHGNLPSPEDGFRADLGGGVRIVMPLALPINEDGETIPKADMSGEEGEKELTCDDPAFRAAIIAVAWSSLQHFYPYFDVVGVDWQAELPEAMRAAVAAENVDAFNDAFRRFVAALDDGHGFSTIPTGMRSSRRLPIDIVWTKDGYVISGTGEGADARIEPGDLIVRIDGRDAEEYFEEQGELISGSPQFKVFQLARGFPWRRGDAEPVDLVLRKPGGGEIQATLRPVGSVTVEPVVKRPENGAEVAPGIVYFNLDGTTMDQLTAVLPKLAEAEGVIFDLRGYPNAAGFAVISNLASEPVRSANWNVATITRPDREGWEWKTSGWTRQPVEPRIKGRAVVMTDGRAISAAETVLAIIKHHNLATIVGSPSAGANGNVTRIELPGGYAVMMTGMKVTNHDGSRHHLVGVVPHIHVVPTAAGIAARRDELLEKAIEIARGADGGDAEAGANAAAAQPPPSAE